MLQETQDRLKEEVPDLKLVAGAAAFSMLKENPSRHQLPAAYVIPLADRASPNSLANGVRQMVTSRVGILLAVSSLRDPRGEETVDLLEPLRAKVVKAVLGWSPTTDDEPMTFLAGQVIAVRNGVLWWQDEFATGNTIED